MSSLERLDALFVEETQDEIKDRKRLQKEEEEELLEKIKQSTKKLHNMAANN